MLTKSDLQAIRGIVVNEVNGSETRVKRELGKKIDKVQKTLEEMDKFLDKEIMADRKRIVKIEEKLQIQTA
jgi:vacuolar-type H+-ATPase subunit I/STV1